jgi:hypothetical protein
VPVDEEERWTKHHPHAFARSLGFMDWDWDTQPNPFRRYKGAAVMPLAETAPTGEPTFDGIYKSDRVVRRTLDPCARHLAKLTTCSSWRVATRS